MTKEVATLSSDSQRAEEVLTSTLSRESIPINSNIPYDLKSMKSLYDRDSVINT